MIRFTVALGISLLLQSCSYAISPPLARQADRSVAFDLLLDDPDLYKGKVLILGGAIVETVAGPKGTLLTVMQRPLDYWGKPIRTMRTGGRFILFHPSQLDDLLYAPGRELTVAAEVAGTALPQLEGRKFIDPVLIVREIKLWERSSQAAGPPRWGDPLYDRYQRMGRPE